MQAVFIKILNLSITASFLIVAVILLRQLFCKAPKWIRYILWSAVALRLMIPFSFESSLSILPNAQKIDTTSTTSTSYIAPVAQQAGSSQVGQTASGMSAMDILSFIWIAGVVAMLVYMTVSLMRVHFQVRESVKLHDNIYICDHIGSPFVLGFFRPRIYLNSGVSKEDAKYIIAHEQTHIRHFDNVFKPLAFVLLSVYWFNPLCYIAYALFVKDIELFCDESVIKTLDADGKKNYSAVLLQCGLSTKGISRCPLAFSEGNLKHRIKSVLKYKKPPKLLVITTVVMSCVVLTLFMSDPVSIDATATQIQPAQAVTQAEPQAPTQAPTQPATEEPTEKETEPPTQAPTEAEYVEEYYDYSYDYNTDYVVEYYDFSTHKSGSFKGIQEPDEDIKAWDYSNTPTDKPSFEQGNGDIVTEIEQ